MKKLLLILCLVLASNLASSAQRTKKVDVKDTSGSPNTKGRSVTILPHVWIDSSSSELIISLFSADESYNLVVYGASGALLCQFALLTDGVAHTYQLPDLEVGQYSIVIESEKRTFEGEIII